MTSLPKPPNKILRGVNVQGIVFCTPTGEIEQEQRKIQQEQEHLKTLEDFWLDKGFQRGLEKGFEEGWKKGEQDGISKGLVTGKQLGREESREEFIQEGVVLGHTKAQEELQELTAHLNELAKSLEQQQEHFIGTLKNDLVELSLQICSKVLKQALQIPSYFQNLVEKVIEQYHTELRKQPIVLKVPSTHLSMIDQWKKHSPTIEKYEILRLDIQADDKLLPGDFIIQFPSGLLHLNLDRELVSVKEALCAASLES